MCGIVAVCNCELYQNTCNRDVNTSSQADNGANGVDYHLAKVPTDKAENPVNTSAREQLAKQLQASIDKIEHRGPDGSGVWVSADSTVGLAHCRLSIIDLSPRGAQPLHSDDGLIHAVVNGEIYDSDRLRKVCIEEHNYKFVGGSDSELVISLYRIYGAPALFDHLRGEFAFVIVDERPDSMRVIAGRDRFGIKPLYWTVAGGKVLLASEIKAFLPLGWKAEWDVRSIADGGWLVDNRTIFKDVRKLEPGHWMDLSEGQGMAIHRYWDAEYAEKTHADPRTFDEMVLGVRERLEESIKLRLRADVPIAISLSGGIDSSAVAGIAADLFAKEKINNPGQNRTPLTFFTVRYPQDSGHDETDIADRTAEWLGVDLLKKDVNEEVMAELFAEATYHAEHHVFELSIVSKFALSARVQEHGLKVILNGEGSDEHFAGYPTIIPEYLRETDHSMPGCTLSTDTALRESLFKSALVEASAVFGSIGYARDDDGKGANNVAYVTGNTMTKTVMGFCPTDRMFLKKIRDQKEGSWDIRKTLVDSYPPEVRAKMQQKWHPTNTAMYIWGKSIMANAILAGFGDRADMSHSVEGRIPFLDHHLAEYVNMLPPSSKLKHAPSASSENSVHSHWLKASGSALQAMTEKWVLREAVRPYVTDEVYKRKKVPFVAPVRWPENGPLHNLFKGLLTREAVENLGFVDYPAVAEAFNSAFGNEANPISLRLLCTVGSWVVLADKFQVKKASMENLGRF